MCRLLPAHGFTLTEVLVATMVVATVAGGVAGLGVECARGMAGARFRVVSASLARSQAERLRAGLVASAGTEYFDADARPLGPAPSSASGVYVVRWSTAPAPLAPSSCVTFDVRAHTVAADRLATAVPDDARIVGVARGAS